MTRAPARSSPRGSTVASALDQATRDILRSFLNDIRSLPNESAKTHRFIALVAQLFPETSAVSRIASGVEKLVRIDTAKGLRRRRIDTYYGNAIIEFENSLAATETIALRQLQEQASGVWADEGKPYRSLLCIATDGIVWKIFSPQIKSFKHPTPRPSDVELEPLRTLELSNETLDDFWFWLTNLLFRPGRTVPTAQLFAFDFGATSVALADAMVALQRAWDAAGSMKEPQTAFGAWQRYLTFTYGSVTQEGKLLPLFLKHTYLASIARLTVWASLSGGKMSGSLAEAVKEILNGEYFWRHGIENLVEDDFFQWIRLSSASNLLMPVWLRIVQQLLNYDLRKLNEDVLKGIYQELVDPKDRHDLGEYYTPDWLCERIVRDILPNEGFVPVLDPACGSGSFLRAVIAHQLKANPSGGDVTRLRSVLDNVVGIDIHPLAVTIARATYTLVLRSLVKATKRPIHIPVYLADSLFLPSEVTQMELGQTDVGYQIRFGRDKKISMPKALLESGLLFDRAISASSRVALDHARTGKESVTTLANYLAKAAPSLRERTDAAALLKALWDFTLELSDLIKKQDNSIWAFIVKNNYRPAMLRERFAYIVGNPPWLSYRYIDDPDYQDEVKTRAVNQYKIAPTSQRLMSQMELATVFLAHCIANFGRDDAKLAFVMPRSVLTADQHENLRNRKYNAPFRIERYWDLVDVQPIFNVPSCVLFARKGRVPRSGFSYQMPAVEWSGRLPSRDLRWCDAEPHLSTQRRTARLILGSRTALSTQKGTVRPYPSSSYAKRFRNGATIYPRNFYFVKVGGLRGRADPSRLYSAETEPQQAKEAKDPYKGVSIKGRIEGQFFYSTALSRHVLPFIVLEPSVVVLPVLSNKARLRILSPAALRKAGFRDMARWSDQVEAIWKTLRSKKATETAVEWLDYQGKLSAQRPDRRILILYNASGTDLCAARLDTASVSHTFVVDHKLYWIECNAADEAAYLTAVLNSNAVNQAIKPFQSRGLMGERDIHKKVLDLPIPKFTGSNKTHRRLSALGTRAQTEVAKIVRDVPLPRALAGRRRALRAAIGKTLDEIDATVRLLL